jgi:hypothetical protein
MVITGTKKFSKLCLFHCQQNVLPRGPKSISCRSSLLLCLIPQTHVRIRPTINSLTIFLTSPPIRARRPAWLLPTPPQSKVQRSDQVPLKIPVFIPTGSRSIMGGLVAVLEAAPLDSRDVVIAKRWCWSRQYAKCLLAEGTLDCNGGSNQLSEALTI